MHVLLRGEFIILACALYPSSTNTVQAIYNYSTLHYSQSIKGKSVKGTSPGKQDKSILFLPNHICFRDGEFSSCGKSVFFTSNYSDLSALATSNHDLLRCTATCKRNYCLHLQLRTRVPTNFLSKIIVI